MTTRGLVATAVERSFYEAQEPSTPHDVDPHFPGLGPDRLHTNASLLRQRRANRPRQQPTYARRAPREHAEDDGDAQAAHGGHEGRPGEAQSLARAHEGQPGQDQGLS